MLYNVQTEMKKLRDTGDYSKNELARLEEEMKQHNKEERQRKQEERFKELGPYRNPKTGGFMWYEVANDLVASYPCINVNGTVAIWTGNCYSFDVSEFVKTKIKEFDVATRKSDRTEVYNTIVDNIEDYPKFTEVDKYKIAFLNGVLDLKTLVFEHGNHQEYAILNCIPHNYIEDPEEQPKVQEWLMNLADNDERVYKLLLQLVGYPMLVNCNLRTMFMLIGRAQGGKTKFVEHMQYIYGKKNYSTFSAKEVTGRFNKVQTCGRLFNYSDDIDADYFDKPGEIKKLISGQTSLQVERKGIDGYGLPFYAKLIMSMNEFPKIKMDKDVTGWQSRLNIIEFKHKFEKNPFYDEWAEATLRNSDAIGWLIKKATIAINTALNDGEFCYSDKALFAEFLDASNRLVMIGVRMTEDDWKDEQHFKTWFERTKNECESKMSIASFISLFNEVSPEFEVYETKEKRPGADRRTKTFKIRYKVSKEVIL